MLIKSAFILVEQNALHSEHLFSVDAMIDRCRKL